MINKLVDLVLLQMFLAFGFSSVILGSESFLKLYPLPASELKTVVSTWFLESGFEVHFSAAESGQVIINAIKGKNGWQLSLTPHSPLATKVMVRTEKDVQAEPLWRHISAYLKKISAHAQNENRRLAIPSVVMAKNRSVVCIKTTEAEENLQLSGFSIDSEGVILCTAHDLKGHSLVSVMLHDGTEIEGQVLRIDASRDLAVILVSQQLDQFIDLRSGYNHLGKNERLFSVGCPMNVLGVIQPGNLSGGPRRMYDFPLWQVEMAMQPGSSGSPVFDTAGRLVGMVKGRYRGTGSQGFLIPFATLLEFVKGNGEL